MGKKLVMLPIGAPQSAGARERTQGAALPSGGFLIAFALSGGVDRRGGGALNKLRYT